MITKKAVKVVLLVLMLVGVVIAVMNVTSVKLQSDFQVRVVTYTPEPPDCDGSPKDCNDFTRKAVD